MIAFLRTVFRCYSALYAHAIADLQFARRGRCRECSSGGRGHCGCFCGRTRIEIVGRCLERERQHFILGQIIQRDGNGGRCGRGRCRRWRGPDRGCGRRARRSRRRGRSGRSGRRWRGTLASGCQAKLLLRCLHGELHHLFVGQVADTLRCHGCGGSRAHASLSDVRGA